MPEIVYQGKFLAFAKEGRWEYVDRVNASGAVIIAAVTGDRKLLLVEQFRIPVKSRTIELPAGITGDDVAGEPCEEAARRELLEETGYRAGDIRILSTGPASSGLTSELVTLVLAVDLKREHAGGGVENENITVHEVPLDEVHAWLENKAREGCMIDPKIYSGLYFLFR